MSAMIVCMDYTQDGSRTISQISYSPMYEADYRVAVQKANVFSSMFDEVYIIDFDPNNKDFINEIVLKGCRIPEKSS